VLFYLFPARRMRAFFQVIIHFLKRLFRREQPSVSQREITRAAGGAEDSARLAEGSLAKGSPESASAELRRLVYIVTYPLKPAQRVHASRIGALLREQDPTFSYEKYGFNKLIDLLRAVPELVVLEKVEPLDRTGSAPSSQRLAPVYYVRSRSDTTVLIIDALSAFSSATRDESTNGQWAERESTWVHWQSLTDAIAQKDATFNALCYGFSSVKALLKSRDDLVEFKAESPDYVRLKDNQGQLKSNQNSTLASTLVRPVIKSPVTKSPAIKPPAIKPSVVKTSVVKPSVVKPKTTLVRPNLGYQNGSNIESLLKFAGLSIEELHQKIGELAVIALPETWYFGPQPPDSFAYPILKSYLRYTFVRLQHEKKVLTSANQRYLSFNTGLLDTLLRPIYALLTRSAPTAKWTLDFCIAGEDYIGKTLVSEFSQLPTAANYFENADKAFYYLGAGAPTVDWQHVVKDNMARLPLAFLERYAPKGFSPRSTQQMSTPEFYEYKRSFTMALEADPSGYRNIVSRLEEALEKTLRRTQVNYTTAVPTYYPKINSIDLMLPMCLVSEHTVDLALVVRREPSGKYIGHTVLTLRQAYNNARLICKLDNHWLPRALTLSQTVR